MDARRWVSGDGSWETDDNQSPFLYLAMKLQSIPMPNTIPNQSRVTQVQCRYRTSRTRIVFGGATIFKEEDDSAGIATTPTANNYRTGSAGMKHCETHSPVEKAVSGMCTQRSDGKHTYR